MNSSPRHSATHASLRELALRSPDPIALADFYGRALGLVFRQDSHGLLGMAPGRRLRIVEGPAKTLEYAGFALADPADGEALAQRLLAAGISPREAEMPGFAKGALRFEDPDGNAFIFGLASDGSVEVGGEVSQWPARLQHVVFATQDIGRLLQFHEQVTGFTISDKVLDDAGELRTAFLRCSDDHHSLAMFAGSRTGLDHHCLETASWNAIRDWSDHFATERIQLKWGPGRHGPGSNLFVFAHDIDGNWVELSAELEQVAPDREMGHWPHEERTLNSWGIGLLRS